MTILANPISVTRADQIRWSGGNPFEPGDVIGRGERYFYLTRVMPCNGADPLQWWFDGVWDIGVAARFQWPDGQSWRLVRVVKLEGIFGGKT